MRHAQWGGLRAGTKWRTGQATKFVSRCKGGSPAGGNFFACPVAASKRGLQPVPRSDQPIWTARGALPIKTDQGWKATMELWNCHVVALSYAGMPLPSLPGLSVPDDGSKRPALSDIATHSTALGIQSKPEAAVTIPVPADRACLPALLCFSGSNRERNLDHETSPAALSL